MVERSMTARQFFIRVVGLSGLASLATIGIVTVYLVTLLRLPVEHWREFAYVVACLFPVLFTLVTLVNGRIMAPIIAFLAADERGEASEEQLRVAFQNLSNQPVWMSVAGVFWWTVGGLLVAGWMKLRFASFGWFPFGVMSMSAVTGGAVTTTFLFFLMKRAFRETVADMAARMGDSAARRDLVWRVPLRRKLIVSITTVTFAVVVFSMFLAIVRSSQSLEQNATRIQSSFLRSVVTAVESGGPAAVSALREEARKLSVAQKLVIVDRETGELVAGEREDLFPEELSQVLASNGPGTSDLVDSPNAFAWHPVGTTSLVLVAASEWSTIRGDSGGVGTIFGLVLLISVLTAYALSILLAGDVALATDGLREEALRMAAGDLRPGRIFESEDELGDLARAFERMTENLRTTVGSVAQAADRVDGAAAAIADASEMVATGAVEQSKGVRSAASSMGGINGEVAGIAASSRDLNLLVEESSSSILEMGTASEQLNDTAGVLSGKIDEVSSSIEQMIGSVKEVSSHTGTLTDAAVDTSSSMEEMASAMRQVDANAEETARLSRRVVESAEDGQSRVRETIEGMDSIREATATAERVIRGLGVRTKEIGSILDVIDDVADETGLLALNAAIIAAQAGEHGRAFSVVADEIKDLADRVLSSTKEIAAVIHAAQSESENAVGAIEEGARSVAVGMQRSQQAGHSLEEITGAARESGMRIHEIVRSVQEQTRAAGYVVTLMEKVSDGVEAIRRASEKQERGNEVVFRSSAAMRDVARQVRGTTEEQTRSSARIRESIEGVRGAVEAIHAALEAQSESCREVSSSLEQVSEGTRVTEQTSERMKQAVADLQGQAEHLRAGIARFAC